VTRTLDGAGRRVELALGERPVVVGAAILDRVELPSQLKDTDLAAVVLERRIAPRAARRRGRR